MDTDATRALVKTYYETLASGDRVKLASLFTEDAELIPPESVPFERTCGAAEVARHLGGEPGAGFVGGPRRDRTKHRDWVLG